jgi:hypothetical protein
MVNEHIETIIVGAGISGLLAGKILSQAGLEVLILEKSRGFGGRMATRRFGGGVFDHGAQFFTAREPGFQHRVDRWVKDDTARVWFGSRSNAIDQPEKVLHPRYCGSMGMANIAKRLARGLEVRLNTRVLSVSREGSAWTMSTEDGKGFSASNLILTAPVPQALNLLEAGGVELPEQEHEALRGIVYHPCIAGLFLLEGPSAIPAPGGMKLEPGDIQWLGDNSQKGISPDVTAVTIHAAPDFSRRNFELPADEISDMLVSAAAAWLGQDIRDWQIHKWRYSQPEKTYPRRYMEAAGLEGLYMAGDAFGGAKIEGAALSGAAAANHLLEKRL